MTHIALANFTSVHLRSVIKVHSRGPSSDVINCLVSGVDRGHFQLEVAMVNPGHETVL
jgi:hypothetical protein